MSRSAVPGAGAVDSRGGLSGYHDAAPPCQNQLFYEKETEGPQENDKVSADEKDFTPETVTKDHPKGRVESRFSPFEALITRSFGEAEGDLMAEDEEILSRGTAELGGRNGADTRGSSRLQKAVGQYRHVPQSAESIMGDSESVQSASISHIGMDSVHSDASALPGKKNFGWNSMTEKVVDVLENKQISHMGSPQGLPDEKLNAYDLDAGISHAQYMKLANVSNNPEDGFSALVTNLRFFVNFRQYARHCALRLEFSGYLFFRSWFWSVVWHVHLDFVRMSGLFLADWKLITRFSSFRSQGC